MSCMSYLAWWHGIALSALLALSKYAVSLCVFFTLIRFFSLSASCTTSVRADYLTLLIESYEHALW